jgi:hypothetical protein
VTEKEQEMKLKWEDLEPEIKDMARETFKDQGYDDLLAAISTHRDIVPPNIWANAQALIAFTILDEVWRDADCCFLDYGDEQSAAIYALENSILGKEEVERILDEEN